jgi:hypothetical protein
MSGIVRSGTGSVERFRGASPAGILLWISEKFRVLPGITGFSAISFSGSERGSRKGTQSNCVALEKHTTLYIWVKQVKVLAIIYLMHRSLEQYNAKT